MRGESSDMTFYNDSPSHNLEFIRAHASFWGIGHLLPAEAGKLSDRE